MRKKAIPKYLLQTGMLLADGKYRIDELLGDNGLTITYKGYDVFRRKVIVIRELFPKIIMQRNYDKDYKIECKKLSDEELFVSMKEHMIQRAKKLIRLYPVEGITNVLTYLEEKGTVYAIEEYAPGQSLEELLWKRHSAKFLAEDIMKYMAPVIDTLSNLHKNGMFHGAVYPENIRFMKNGKPVLVGCVNPMEDVAATQLYGCEIRNDAFSPVELFVPEARRGSGADIYEVAAIFYRYVTGENVPVYYDRVNGEVATTEPSKMLTRVMDFQSEAIMKGIAIYDFERFETIQEFKEAVCPPDVDFEHLNSDMHIARNFRREPFWYRREKKVQRKYKIFILVAMVIMILILGPVFAEIGRGIYAGYFYKKLRNEDVADQFEMIIELSEPARKWYTNDYTDIDSDLTDEQKSKQAKIRCYDFQLKKYIPYQKVDFDRKVYEYMRIDYKTSEVVVSYLSPKESTQIMIYLHPVEPDKYKVETMSVDKKGKKTVKTDYITYKKEK